MVSWSSPADETNNRCASSQRSGLRPTRQGLSVQPPILVLYTSRYGITEWSLILVAVFSIAINAPHWGGRE
jgi:hypothetical protein